MNKIINLVAEYKADPNCRPLLWIECEHVTVLEQRLFLFIIANK